MATVVVYQPPSQREWARTATNPRIRAALADVANKAKPVAQSLAPVESGQYKSSFDVRMSTVMLSGRTRAAADLVNTAPYAAVVETRHHVLARTRDRLNAR